MSKTPKPWFRSGRGWFVTIGQRQFNLGRDKKLAFQEYYRLMRQPKAARNLSGRLLAAVIDDFLDFVLKNRASDTYIWYRDLLQKFILLHPDLRIDDLRPYHVQRWVDGYPHLAKTSRRNHFRSVKTCVKWALSQGYIEQNPLEHLGAPAAESKEVLVTESEYRQMLDFAKPDSIRDLLIVTRETGCRPQESLRVEARHVDKENQRWVIPASEAKGEKIVRTVYLTDRAFEITRRLMLKYPDGTLFRNTQGASWTSDAVNCAIDRIRLRIGKQKIKERELSVSDDEIGVLIPELNKTKMCNGDIRPKLDWELKMEAKSKLAKRLAMSLVPRYSLYAFRHTFATGALQSGVDSVTVAVLLGHTDPSMLAKVYQHLAQSPSFMLEQVKKARATA